MNTFTVDQLRADTLKQTMTVLGADPRKLPEGYHSVEVEPGLAMLVEPLNDHPYVFMPPNVVHQFESAPGSGTDRLRKRIEAGLFFSQLVDNKRAAELRAPAVMPSAPARAPRA